MAEQLPHITHKPGVVYSLHDLLDEWGVLDCLQPPVHVAPQWRCIVAHNIETEFSQSSLERGDDTEGNAANNTQMTADQRVADCIASCSPVILPAAHSSEVYRACENDGIAFINAERWRSFPRPKIAFKGGWGQPGSVLADHRQLKLVDSFSQVLSSDTVLNLQMFHRRGRDEPSMPPLAPHIKWPLPEVFEDHGVVVDNATRVSKRGALTWWHLDDGGEFVLQTGLPTPGIKPRLIGPSGRPVVKLFIFAPLDSYDLVFQDDESAKTEAVAALDVFNTPSHHLPAAERLPTLIVAPLEAGGGPLLSPPNLPHVVLTIQDCVMVEQRRICQLFLDESKYWLDRTRKWEHPPVLYEYLSKTLKAQKKTNDGTVQPLLRTLSTSVSRLIGSGTGPVPAPRRGASDNKGRGRRHAKTSKASAGAQGVSEETISHSPREHTFDLFKASRAYCALEALLEGTAHFNLSKDIKDEVRQALSRTKSKLESAGFWAPVEQDLRHVLLQQLQAGLRQQTIGLTRCSWRSSGYNLPAPPTSDTQIMSHLQIDGRPLFGPVRSSVAEALDDRRHMQQLLSCPDRTTAEQAILSAGVMAGKDLDVVKSRFGHSLSASEYLQRVETVSAQLSAASSAREASGEDDKEADEAVENAASMDLPKLSSTIGAVLLDTVLSRMRGTTAEGADFSLLATTAAVVAGRAHQQLRHAHREAAADPDADHSQVFEASAQTVGTNSFEQDMDEFF